MLRDIATKQVKAEKANVNANKEYVLRNTLLTCA